MDRVLALDVGTKRIGVALSDPLLIIAQPLKTINRTPEEKSVKQIKDICSEYDVKEIVLGLPKNMNNTLGSQSEDVLKYSRMIEESTDAQIIFEDERLTSKEAEQILISQNKKPFKNKGLIDMTAAAIILQQYLDKRSK